MLKACICLRPQPDFLSQNSGSPGEGQGGAAWKEAAENWREGELEQKTLGPELGVSGIAPTSRTLSNLLPTGQNLQVYFYSKKRGGCGVGALAGW